MKAAAMSVWIFINLLCFGMCGYLYLIWSQYWLYLEKQKLSSKTLEVSQKMTISGSTLASGDTTVKFFRKTNAFNSSSFSLDKDRKIRRSAIGSFWNSIKVTQTVTSSAIEGRPSVNVITKSQGSPRFPNIHTPLLEFDSEKYVCDDMFSTECKRKTKEFKELLLKEFHRVLMGDSKVFKSGLESLNHYNVQYDVRSRKQSSRQELLCYLKGVPLKTVTADDEPFKELGYHIPPAPLQDGRFFNTCAVVTSAGALLKSRLGSFIDSHDMVLRFNNAPTENYTDDVGYKTTFRIINSQVVVKPEYNFLEDPMYSNVSILIWDPANFTSTLKEWFNHSDFPLFPVYKRLLEIRKHVDVHLLKPKVLWDLWTLLQDNSPYRLRRNPPSSGFVGIWFALQRCNYIRVFEYIPTVRASSRCHYYREHRDAACTLGAWHPLAQEKALAERMRDNPDFETFQRGYISIPGLKNINCL